MARYSERGPLFEQLVSWQSRSQRLRPALVGVVAPCGASVVVDIDVPLRWGTESDADPLLPVRSQVANVAEATSGGKVSTPCQLRQRCVEQRCAAVSEV